MLQRLGQHETRIIHERPLYATRVPAGFPSPADDYLDRSLDLNEYLIKHPAATFYCRVSGSSMEGAGIYDGDLLIVDRSLEPKQGSVVVAALDGELTCKVLDLDRRQLLSCNPDYPAINISEAMDLIIEGVVAYSVRAHVCTG